MKKIGKGIMAIVLGIGILLCSCYYVEAAETVTYTKETSSGYTIHTLTASLGPAAQSKKLDALGFNKTAYTTGTITITKSQTKTFNASATVSLEYKVLFAKMGNSVSIASSYSKNVQAGISVQVLASAPNGIYYAYIAVPQRKVRYKVQTCSKNHTNWATKYNKVIEYAPVKNAEYIEIKRG